jgi:hypothetical protein
MVVAGPSPGDLFHHRTARPAHPSTKDLQHFIPQLRKIFHAKRTAQRPDRGEMTGLGSTRERLGSAQPPWDG